MKSYSNIQLYNALKELEVVESASLKECLDIADKDKKSLSSVLIEKDLLSDENIGIVIADILELPFIKLSSVDIPKDVLEFLPESFAKSNKTVVFKIENSTLHIAASGILDEAVVKNIERKFGNTVKAYYATEDDVAGVLVQYKNTLSTNKSSENADTLLYRIIENAYDKKASDIHIEPKEEFAIIRYRIDGIMHDILKVDKNAHEQLINKIKVEAKLRTDEHLSAQDGKMKAKLESENLDIRVSLVPVIEGENCVMRLLSSNARQFGLSDLGVSKFDLDKVTAGFTKPHGMVLATGPTGSGKTTTLYSIIKLLNKRERNIDTIEDPVEYEISGINQIQVNPKTNLTFAEGLKSILRQDPDIIFVGEIRDKETAGIAINAAMTGHLVLSSLHTNDAATSLPRLIDMGIEPFLVASTVNTIIAQRLVRKICTKCIYSYDMTSKELTEKINHKQIEDVLSKAESFRLYKGKGCAVCNNTGYRGRIGIFEVLEISEKIRELISKSENANKINEQALKEGMTSMFMDGISKVLGGVTTIEEVLRVTKS